MRHASFSVLVFSAVVALSAAQFPLLRPGVPIFEEQQRLRGQRPFRDQNNPANAVRAAAPPPPPPPPPQSDVPEHVRIAQLNPFATRHHAADPQAHPQHHAPAPAPAPPPPPVQVPVQREQFESVNTKNTRKDIDEAELFRQQAENAHYAFHSDVEDGISGGGNHREEVRDGTKVSGVYSYNDGYFMRTVYYEADENGYRVVKEENDPIGNGPSLNVHGSADVETMINGIQTKYTVRAEDIPAYNEKRNKNTQERDNLREFS